MKIAESAVMSESSHSFSLKESVIYAKYRLAEANPKNEKNDQKAAGNLTDGVSISDEAQSLLEDAEKTDEQEQQEKTSTKGNFGIAEFRYAVRDFRELKFQMIQTLMRRLLGKDFELNETLSESLKRLQSSSQQISIGASRGGLPVNTKVYDVTQFSYAREEKESVSYHTAGIIRTQDGREISIDIKMNMSREAAEYFDFTKKREIDPSLCDPIIINYAGGIPELAGEKFSFDLDLDGKKDNIAFAGAGSGFLAIDKNGDGVINDGSELFGPMSGNGFSELRQADNDKNGWIDENDEIFSKLRIWTKDRDGNDTLYTLKDLNIGALYLGDTSTEFSLDGGVMRSTSFYLKEDGMAGLMSHIDLKL